MPLIGRNRLRVSVCAQAHGVLVTEQDKTNTIMKRHKDNGERVAFAFIAESSETRRRKMADAIHAALNLIEEESQSPLASGITPAETRGTFSVAPAFAVLDNLDLPNA